MQIHHCCTTSNKKPELLLGGNILVLIASRSWIVWCIIHNRPRQFRQSGWTTRNHVTDQRRGWSKSEQRVYVAAVCHLFCATCDADLSQPEWRRIGITRLTHVFGSVSCVPKTWIYPFLFGFIQHKFVLHVTHCCFTTWIGFGKVWYLHTIHINWKQSIGTGLPHEQYMHSPCVCYWDVLNIIADEPQLGCPVGDTVFCPHPLYYNASAQDLLSLLYLMVLFNGKPIHVYCNQWLRTLVKLYIVEFIHYPWFNPTFFVYFLILIKVWFCHVVLLYNSHNDSS